MLKQEPGKTYYGIVVADYSPYADVIGVFDSKNNAGKKIIVGDVGKTNKAFKTAVNNSIKLGWKVAHFGERNQG